MKFVSPDQWRPNGIDDLEPAAWQALRDERSTSVTAGPGAGKTEFLAQRASYLLETGLCPPPRRILAITFKRDAATNIRRRVAQRTPEHAARLTAMTFDAFTKSIVDRFHTLLPEYWKMNGQYDIRFASPRQVGDFFENIAQQAPPGLAADVRAIPQNDFIAATVGNHSLPATPGPPATATGYAIQQWWQRSYLNPEVPSLDFVMINRLAELIIRHSPALQRALHETYPFVFVDEFQDTTFAQYTFLRSVFGRHTTVTAVGDRKQRIMGWAGALDDAFAEFAADFKAAPYELTWNFRSTEALVALQHRFAQLLDPATKPAAAQAVADIDDQPAQIWSFPSQQREAQTVAAFIAADIAASDRTPADYALVARQKVADFETGFRYALAAQDIGLRNDDAMCGEMRLQDLLKDSYGGLLVGLLRLGARSGHQQGSPRTWIAVSTSIARSSSGDDLADEVAAHRDDRLSASVRALRSWLGSHGCDVDNVPELIELLRAILEDLTDGHLTSLVDSPDDLPIRDEAFRVRLSTVVAETDSWWKAADAYESVDAVSLLTIHRSKGLEYHTVFVLGLDNDQWWSHRRETAVSTSTFFVGLSRAAQRVIFTQCSQRGGHTDLADLYAVLEQAGIAVHHF
jgi:superfamily I DNA/RNA helicase